MYEANQIENTNTHVLWKSNVENFVKKKNMRFKKKKP